MSIKRLRIECVVDGMKTVVSDADTGEVLSCVSSIELVNTKEQGKGVKLFIAEGESLELDVWSQGMLNTVLPAQPRKPPSLTYLMEDPERFEAFKLWYQNYLMSPRSLDD